MDPPIFKSLTAPGNKKTFNELMSLLPPDRATSMKLCYKCEKNVGDLKKCSKCKSIWYCSVECQRADWPDHKQWCNSTKADNFARLQKLIQNFIASPVLIYHIQTYCALAFDLGAPSGCCPDKARHVLVDVGLEPLDITAFYKLSTSQLDDVPRPIRGMLQITKITRSPESQTIPENRMFVWRQARKEAIACGGGDYPIVLVEYRLREDMGTMTTTVPIPLPMLQIVRERKPFECVSAIRGKFEKPMTESNIIEMLNMTIRQDKRGVLKVQVPLDESDIEIIQRWAQADENSPGSMRRLHEKTKREDIYMAVMISDPTSVRM